MITIAGGILLAAAFIFIGIPLILYTLLFICAVISAICTNGSKPEAAKKLHISEAEWRALNG